MKTIVWDPGMIPYNKLSGVVDMLVKEGNCIHIITEHRRRKDWEDVLPKCQLQIYQQFDVTITSSAFRKEDLDFIDVFQNIINDYRTLLIAERVLSYNRWGSTFSNIRNIEIIIYNTWMFLTEVCPDFLIFQATPHALNSWILGKVAEILSIPVYMIQTSPLPWRFWMIEGIDRQKLVFPKDQCRKCDCPFLSHYLKINTASYIDAIPSYEKKRIDSRGGRFWSWKKELQDVAKHPSLIRTLIKKKKLYEVYNSLCIKRKEVDTKHVVFFMHYQPERTSLPEGKLFSNQWLIIRALSMTLPKGWRLLVKEHPSIFTGRFNWRYRDPQFYSDIASLSNVDLISIEEDTFGLIDCAEAIASITGTVGVQSLIRGTPVFVFGYGSYRTAYGAFEISNLNDLRLAFMSITTMEKRKVAEETKQYLQKIVGVSVSVLNNPQDNADVYGRETRIRGHVELLRTFFENI